LCRSGRQAGATKLHRTIRYGIAYALIGGLG
jgi:hypothetical protein